MWNDKIRQSVWRPDGPDRVSGFGHEGLAVNGLPEDNASGAPVWVARARMATGLMA